MCNVAYSILAEGRDDEAVSQLDIAIGMVRDPADEAMTALRQHQRAAGIEFEDPDAPVSAADDGTERWMVTDEEFR